MATKKQTVAKVVEAEPEVAEMVKTEPDVAKVEQAEANVPEAEKAEPEVSEVENVEETTPKPDLYTPYVPVELRTKLEGIAIKMLTKLEKYPGDFNEGQLKTVEAVLNIYQTIRY